MIIDEAAQAVEPATLVPIINGCKQVRGVPEISHVLYLWFKHTVVGACEHNVRVRGIAATRNNSFQL